MQTSLLSPTIAEHVTVSVIGHRRSWGLGAWTLKWTLSCDLYFEGTGMALSQS